MIAGKCPALTPAPIDFGQEQKLLLKIAPGALVEFGLTSVQLPCGTILTPRSVTVGKTASGDKTWACSFSGGLEIEHTFTRTGGIGFVQTRILSNGPSSTVLSKITVGGASRVLCRGNLDRVYWQTQAMDGFSGISDTPDLFYSWGMCAFTDSDGDSAFLAGFGDFARYHSEIRGARESQSSAWLLDAHCDMEAREMKPGETMSLPPLLLAAGPSLAGLLEKYALSVAKAMGVKSSFPPSPRGWCSWYCYYGRETEADILTNLDYLSSLPRKQEAMFFQIDDGWNLPHPGHPRVWGDWEPGQKFQHGMKWMAQQIQSRGFIPGLWLAPFSVDPASHLATTRPNLLVQTRDPLTGNLNPASVDHDGKRLILDLTHPEAIEFIRQTFRRVFSDWGFKYVKLDFLQHALAPGIRHDERPTSIESFRAALQAIREVAGDDVFILCCGSAFGPTIGLCDGMRVGFDTGGGWDSPIKFPSWPDGNCCVKAAAKPAFFRHWMHRHWWINDPDCLIARSEPLDCEVETLTRIAKEMGKPGRAAKFCLTDDEAACWTRFVWMLGGFSMSSEIWSHLTPQRRELLERASRPNTQPTIWVDWYAHPELCILRTKTDPLLVGVFNFSDETLEVGFPASKLALSQWEFSEVFDKATFEGRGSVISFPAIAPHSARIWQLKSRQ